MCGRLTQMMTWEELYGLLSGKITNRIEPEKVYNVAPTMVVLIALPDQDGYLLSTMKWGIQPDWAGSPLINAQAEKVTAPGRTYWSRFRRCLIPASGFYEWKKVDVGPKQPMYVRSADGRPFMFAGLWSTTEEGEERCVIVTAKPNDLMASIHHRMPAILLPEHYEQWLDPDTAHPAMRDVLAPYPADRMVAYPVSRRVNDVKNQSADLVKPIDQA